MALRFWVFGPLLAAALAGAAFAGPWSTLCAAALGGGLFFWTAVEYAMHRFAFHGFAPHYQHHADPTNRSYILAPLWLALAGAAALWLLFSLAARSWVLGTWMLAGAIVGYLAYELIHLRIHSANAGGTVLRALRRHHFYHHFASERACFGVTSPLWDMVFGSLPEASRSSRMRFRHSPPP
ncbi:MAG TPA: sterol desaturase family protein [Bryobacteraceae bacterium]|nr:sterol desaturase family protein [Bryobacteraceae bacterium]